MLVGRSLADRTEKRMTLRSDDSSAITLPGVNDEPGVINRAVMTRGDSNCCSREDREMKQPPVTRSLHYEFIERQREREGEGSRGGNELPRAKINATDSLAGEDTVLADDSKNNSNGFTL